MRNVQNIISCRFCIYYKLNRSSISQGSDTYLTVCICKMFAIESIKFAFWPIWWISGCRVFRRDFNASSVLGNIKWKLILNNAAIDQSLFRVWFDFSSTASAIIFFLIFEFKLLATSYNYTIFADWEIKDYNNIK